MAANILPADTSSPTTLGDGVKRSKINFSEHGNVAYQIKRTRMQQHGSRYFVRIPPSSDPGDGAKRSKFIFSEHGHVAYQIKWNHEMQ